MNKKDPLIEAKCRQDEYWDEIIQGFEDRIRLRAERNRQRYQETLCKCGYDKMKCETKCE